MNMTTTIPLSSDSRLRLLSFIASETFSKIYWTIFLEDKSKFWAIIWNRRDLAHSGKWFQIFFGVHQIAHIVVGSVCSARIMKKISPLEKTWLEVNLEKYGWLCCTSNHFSAHNQAHDNKVPFFLLKYSEKYGFGECTLLPGKILRAAENLRQRNIMNNTWKQRGWWWKGRIGDILFWTFLISGKSNSLLQRWKWKWRLLILKRYCLLSLPPFLFVCSEM